MRKGLKSINNQNKKNPGVGAVNKLKLNIAK